MSRTPRLVIAAQDRATANYHRAAVLEHHGRPVDRLTILTAGDPSAFLGLDLTDVPTYIVGPIAHGLHLRLVSRGARPNISMATSE